MRKPRDLSDAECLTEWLTEWEANLTCDRLAGLFRVTDFDAKSTPDGYRFRVKQPKAAELRATLSQPSLFAPNP